MSDPILNSAERLAQRLERESAELGRAGHKGLSWACMEAAEKLNEAIAAEQRCEDHDNRDADLSHEIFPEGHYQRG